MIGTVILLSLVLRLVALNQSFWIDEATSALVVRKFSVIGIVDQFIINDFHPPLYYIILKLWTGFFGLSELTARLLSVFLGLGSITFVYLISKQLFTKKTALMASLLLATNGLHIYYSQEARMYMMSTFLVTLLYFLFVKIWKNEAKIWWILFSITLVVNFFTDYLPNLIVLSLVLSAFSINKNKTWWKKYIFSHIPLAITFLLWLPTLKDQLKVGISLRENSTAWFNILGRTSIKETLLVPIKFLFGRITIDDKFVYTFVFGVIVLVVFSVMFNYFRKNKFSDSGYRIIFMWLVVPFLISLFLGFFLPVFTYFRIIFVLPALFILLSVAIDGLKTSYSSIFLSFIIFSNMVSSAVYLFNPRFHRENWKAANQLINSEKVKKSGVVFSSQSQKEAYIYYNKKDDSVAASEVDGNEDVVWLFRYVADIFDPADQVAKSIENKDFTKENEYNFNGVVLWKYKKQ